MGIALKMKVSLFLNTSLIIDTVTGHALITTTNLLLEVTRNNDSQVPLQVCMLKPKNSLSKYSVFVAIIDSLVLNLCNQGRRLV